jgi:hypothetical protein
MWTDSFGNELQNEAVYQKNVSRIMNCDLIKISKASDYTHPYELMKADLEEFSGGNIISCEATELMVELDLGSYTAWRKIITPSDTNF